MEFTGRLVEWRGPAPYHFVPLPPEVAEDVRSEAGHLSYGWGMIPVTAHIGRSTFTTAMWPKDGGYHLPVKDVPRRAEALELGREVAVRIELAV